MTQLVRCPLCGSDKGYVLADGSTFRWRGVQCAGCGQEVSECRSDNDTSLNAPKPARDAAADDAWNEAGAYAERLRLALKWYGDEANALAKHVATGVHTSAVLASVTVLSIDAGGRAEAAIRSNEKAKT